MLIIPEKESGLSSVQNEWLKIRVAALSPGHDGHIQNKSSGQDASYMMRVAPCNYPLAAKEGA
eukprot:1149975-Pelagomonas_calceolata.AAC.3